MVNLDKQFAAMAEVSEEDTAYDFVIDEDLRVIAVPERGVVLGVEGDKDVNRVRFRMNRYYRGTDLSDFNIRINYRPAEGEVNYFPVTEKTVQDESICFVWLVGADTVATKGTVYFIARFFTAEEDGTVVQEFNTTLGSARALEGLLVGMQAEDAPVKDLLAQLEYDLKNYAAPFMQQAKTYAENAAQSADSSATSARNAASYAGAAGTSAQNAEASAGKAVAAEQKTQELANEVGTKVTTDPSFSVRGAPADAEATGNALNMRYTKEEADKKFVTPTTLPIATPDTLGGIKVGKGITMDEDGNVSIDAYDKTDMDALLDTLQAQVKNAAGAAAKPVPVWTGDFLPGYKSTRTVTLPEAADYVTVKADTQDDTATYYLLPGKSFTPNGGGTIRFGADKTTITYYNSGAGRQYFAAYHYETYADGVKIPQLVGSKVIGSTYGSQSFTVDDEVDYTEIRWKTTDTTSVDGGTVSVTIPNSLVRLRGSIGNFAFSEAGTLTVLEYDNVGTTDYYHYAFYHYATPEELAAQQTATQEAQADTDAMSVDQEYRITLLELGVTEEV